MAVLYSVAVSLAYSLSCLGLGRLVAVPFARWRRRQNVNFDVVLELANLATVYLLGVATFAALLTLLGVVGMLDRLIIAAALLPGFVVFGLWVIRGGDARRRFFVALASVQRQPRWAGVVLAATVVVSLGFAVAAWFIPPRGDAAAFYLVYPKVIAASGALIPMPGGYEGFSMIGLSAELHFAALLALSDVGAAKLFIFPIALACAALLSGLVRASGGGFSAVVLGCAALLTSSAFHLHVFDGKVDLLATAYGLASLYWLFLRPMPDVGYNSYLVSGVFAGLATVSKFSYIPALGACLLLLLLWRVNVVQQSMRGLSPFLKAFLLGGLIMAGGALLAWVPQFLKNAVLFNAPFAPFFGAAVTDALFNQAWFDPEATWHIVVTYPLQLVFGQHDMQVGGMSFLLLAFLPLLLWDRKSFSWSRPGPGILALAGLFALLVWVALRPSVIAPRYILAPLLLFVPLIVIKVEQVLSAGRGPAFVRGGVFMTVAVAITASCWQFLALPSALAAAVRGDDPSCLLAGQECETLRQVSALAEPGDRMLVATYYSYWLDTSHLQCRDAATEQSLAAEQSDVLRQLQARGFRYVIADSSTFPAVSTALSKLLANGEVGLLEQPDGRPLKVYTVPRGAATEVHCVKQGHDRWVIEESSP